jgi:hypothetical protein
MSDDNIYTLQQENKRLKTILESAYRFKKWAFNVMAKNGIAFVSEDFTDDELTADPNSCACPFCGQIDPRKEKACDWQKCSSCGHQMRKNSFSLPRWKGT